MALNFWKVKEVITQWDPIGLMAYSPEDEYEPEINEILSRTFSDELSKETLANVVHEVFSEYFGESFKHTIKDCIFVSDLILKNL